MKLPRDVSGEQLVSRLKRMGYTVTRQTGSHIRLTTVQGGEHHLTIPDHAELRVGTLAAILTQVEGHFVLTRDDLLAKLFG